MLEKGKLSPYQLFCMVSTFVLGSYEILQSLTAAGRDTWISSILAILPGVIMVLITTRLAVIFPDLTLIEYAQVLFGKVLGKIIGVLYLWFFLSLGALVLRDYGEVMTAEVMPETPMWFFLVTLALVVAFFVYNRVEGMGRISELVLPMTILLSITTVILISLSGIAEIKNLFPLLERGIGKVLLGAVPIASFPFLEVIVFTMIFPYVNIVAQSRKATLWAVIFSGTILFIVLMQNIAIFGEYMATLTYPRFSAVKMISIGNFIERIEIVVLAVWIMGGLIKTGVCLYAFVLGLAQLLGLRDYKFLVAPAMIITVVLAILSSDNTFEILYAATNIYPIYAFPVQVAFPVLMLILAVVRKQGKSAK